MGREVRRVPKDWQHPKRKDGSYQPMYDEDFATAAAAWKESFRKWESGEDPDRAKYPQYEYWEWNGNPPEREYYRPAWADAERTHLMMYEDTSEGTPISPAFETPEDLARWLADTGASSFADYTATYEQWLPICRGGWAPSMVIRDGVLKSGVEDLTERSAS